MNENLGGRELPLLLMLQRKPLSISSPLHTIGTLTDWYCTLYSTCTGLVSAARCIDVRVCMYVGFQSNCKIPKDKKWANALQALHLFSRSARTPVCTCATMANYPLIFGISLAINVAVTFRSSDKFKLYCGSSPRNQEDPHNKHEDEPLLEKGASASDAGDGVGKATEKARHAALLRRYLAVYLLAALSDWLQGPYV